MTTRLKWIIAAGVVAIGVAYAVRRLYYPVWFPVNPPSNAPVTLSDAELAAHIHLPPGFSITHYADVPDARMLRFTATGDLLVSATWGGKVMLVSPDADGDGHADNTRVLLAQLDAPHGLALHGDWLYVAEMHGVFRIRFDAQSGTTSGAREYVVRGLPDGGHWSRTIGIGPDGWLYLSIGSSCNVCLETDPRRAAITRYHLDGSGEERYATGLRNSVGFAWQPGTGTLYATDNGRDWLGDDFPPCELNRVVEGGFYGWPFANGDRVPDPDFGKGHATEIAASLPPAHGFHAHVAPLGITFYDRDEFPPEFHGAAFVAQHGSWNRSRKSGYKVVALHIGPTGEIREQDFAAGFEENEHVYGRPVDVAVGPDGALYVSDDFTGSVYRIAYASRPAATH